MKKPHLEFDLDDDLASAIAPEDVDETHAVAASSTNPEIFTQGRNGVNGFGVIPLWALEEIVRARAHHALPLALVVFRHMRIRRTRTLVITAAIWAKVGSPGKWGRQIALQHLRRVPGVLKLEERHKRLTRYQVTLGDMWDQL
jgi:hypothetical protein